MFHTLPHSPQLHVEMRQLASYNSLIHLRVFRHDP